MELIGRTLGQYEILEEIGRGGMGVVYRGYDPSLERDVAVKVLSPHLVGEDIFVQRFQREARAAARLSHPNIVTIHHIGKEGDLHYIVMTYLPGDPLSERIKMQGPLPLEQVISITEQIAGALDYAHQRGLVHRDVKPANILLDEEGRAILTDFGIVRATEGTQLTGVGATVGTPTYISPEQARGEYATAASDIYALGIVVYEMLAGEVPFTAPTPLAILVKHANEPPPPLRQKNPAVSPAVEQAVLQALSKAPQERPASARAFVETIIAASAGPGDEVETAPPQPPSAIPEWAEKSVLPGPSPAPPYAISRPSQEALPVQRGSFPRWIWAIAGVALVAGLVLLSVRLNFIGKGLPTPTPTAEAQLSPTATGAVQETTTPLFLLPPCQSIGQVQVRPADGMEMICVPAGEFVMGSRPADVAALLDRCPDCQADWFTDEQPQHNVYLDSFWMDRTEVSNAQYALCVQAGTCSEPAFWNDPHYNAPDQPVVGVDWDQAQAYCLWAQARLPTEAEWEKTCRGTLGRTYPWGNSMDRDRLNYCDAQCQNERWQDPTYDDGYGYSAPVGAYPRGASPYGALDMAGNVWEWVADWYDGTYYSVSDYGNPQGPATGALRAMRGGAWHDPLWRVHCSYRYRPGPWFQPEGVGFRCSVSAADE